MDDAAPAPEQQVRMVMAREDRALDRAQAVRQIGGTGKPVVVEGPAGAGKTTMLITARD